MDKSHYLQSLLDFLHQSPTAFHAVSSSIQILERSGFTRLDQGQQQPLAAGRYYVTRNDSSLIAFTWQGAGNPTPLQMVGAHTDSPCLKLKPNSVQEQQNYLQLGVEVYGGALLGPWFDRELSLAGQVCWHDGENTLQTALVDFKRAIGIIPSLAIHLDREVNKGREINRQRELVPILGLTGDTDEGFAKMLQQQLEHDQPGVVSPDITDHELFFYDAAPPALIGLHREFITGARLDNLLSCHAAVQALIGAEDSSNSMIILHDHEEVGSVSASGAQGSFVRDIIERLLPDVEQRQSMVNNSFLISADNAHAVHPNFVDKHDPQHQPKMNHGLVIKTNANQRYATNARTAAQFRMLCRRAEVPVQEFVMRSDMACGSTIGPLTAAEIGVQTVDVGIPSLAMHSIRETAASSDCWALYKVLTTFFNPANPI